MKNLIIIFGIVTSLTHLTALGQQSSHNQKLVSTEYFVNKDPGEGYGTPIVLSQSMKQIDISTMVSTPLSKGDIVYIRAKSSNGKWSGASSVPYRYKSMKSAEYFVKRARKGEKTLSGLMKIQIQEEPSPFFNALSETSLNLSPRDTVYIRFQSTEYIWGEWLRYVVTKTK